MAAINLDSFRTFWTSVKSYLSSHFSDETLLWSSASGATSASLSEATTNFEEIEVEFVCGASETYSTARQRFVPTQSSSLIALYYATANSSSQFLLYIGIFEISSNKKTISFKNGKYAVLKSSNSNNTLADDSTFKLISVRGIKRIT